MSTFLTILILFYVVTAIWQIVKIYDLTQVNTIAKDSSQIANDKDNKINGYLMLGFLIFIYVITIICFIRYGDFPLMSNSASVHGSKIDDLMMISMVLIFFVQTVTPVSYTHLTLPTILHV